MEDKKKQQHDTLSDIAMMVNSESFLKRWERSIKAEQLWPFPVSFSCCSSELKYSSGFDCRVSELDFAGFCEDSSDADLLIVGGTVTHKMAPYLIEIYNKMPKEKWVIAIGACASSGGPYWTQSVVQGIGQLFPVDVYIPGCPPSPEVILQSFEVVKERVRSKVSSCMNQEWSFGV